MHEHGLFGNGGGCAQPCAAAARCAWVCGRAVGEDGVAARASAGTRVRVKLAGGARGCILFLFLFFFFFVVVVFVMVCDLGAFNVVVVIVVVGDDCALATASGRRE